MKYTNTQLHHILKQNRDIHFSENTYYQTLLDCIICKELYKILNVEVVDGQPITNLILSSLQYCSLKTNGKYLEEFIDVTKIDTNIECFIMNNIDLIILSISSRRVQTNEILRSIILSIALNSVINPHKEVHIVDLGCSAGLNLFLDKIFVRDTKVFLRLDKLLELDCRLYGREIETVNAPNVTRRIGIDRNPIDLSNPDEELWMMSLIWANDRSRRELLKRSSKALDFKSIEFIEGNYSDSIKELSPLLHSEQQLVIYQSFSFYQLDEDETAMVWKELDDIGKMRDFHFISYGFNRVNKQCEVNIWKYKSGTKCGYTFAQAHHHGKWMNVI